jgi:hypothetical protein
VYFWAQHATGLVRSALFQNDGSNRSGKGVGASTIAAWARTLPPKSIILDLGCGTGLPISEEGHRVIANAAAALNPGGLFLFTAPQQAHSWTDAMTGLPSRSLGYDAYKSACESVGLTLIPAPPPDAGGNYYYLAQRAKTRPKRSAPSGLPSSGITDCDARARGVR